MAVRTGAQLKTDQATADAALVTAIATPTEVNVQAVITAVTTVVTNGADSSAVVRQPPAAITTYGLNYPHIPATVASQDLAARGLSRVAVGARRDLLLVAKHAASLAFGGSVTAADIAKELRRVQKSLEYGPWAQLRSTSTTN